MTSVVNVKHNKCDVFIYRGTPYGNPFDHNKLGITRKESIALYREYFYNKLKDPAFYDRVQGLKDKVLGCFCKPMECHGDVIVEYLNNETARRTESSQSKRTIPSSVRIRKRIE